MANANSLQKFLSSLPGNVVMIKYRATPKNIKEHNTMMVITIPNFLTVSKIGKFDNQIAVISSNVRAYQHIIDLC